MGRIFAIKSENFRARFGGRALKKAEGGVGAGQAPQKIKFLLKKLDF